MGKHIRQAGFSLVEVLITLSLVTVLSVIALNALTPWLTFKQALDTDRKLQDMRIALGNAYEANAMGVEAVSSSTFLGLANDTAVTDGQCTDQGTTLATAGLSGFLTESGETAARDGFANPVCFYITGRLSRDVEGVRLYFHMMAVVSTGQNGVIDAGTAFNASNGQLTLGGDDRGVVVNGYTVQYAKYRDTLERINRVASLYESYFTTRFLNSADRDVTRNYFYNGAGVNGDAGGSIAPTTTWDTALQALSTSLGVSPVDATSAFETANNIDVANNDESIVVNGQTTTVRSPASLGTGATPPYTALLRARLPGDSSNYLVRAVVGNY